MNEEGSRRREGQLRNGIYGPELNNQCRTYTIFQHEKKNTFPVTFPALQKSVIKTQTYE